MQPYVDYAITSGGHERYSLMTGVSIASLRVSNPKLRLTVAVDAESDAAMRRTRDRLRREVDDARALRFYDPRPMQARR